MAYKTRFRKKKKTLPIIIKKPSFKRLKSELSAEKIKLLKEKMLFYLKKNLNYYKRKDKKLWYFVFAKIGETNLKWKRMEATLSKEDQYPFLREVYSRLLAVMAVEDMKVSLSKSARDELGDLIRPFVAERIKELRKRGPVKEPKKQETAADKITKAKQKVKRIVPVPKSQEKQKPKEKKEPQRGLRPEDFL